MTKEIQLRVALDDQQIPKSLAWQASDAAEPGWKTCEAFLLALWDAEDRSTMRIDLWTKDMQIDHMNAFFLQTLMTMADTFESATRNQEVAADIRRFAEEIAGKLRLPAEETAEGAAGPDS